jgi:hypothetical protein
MILSAAWSSLSFRLYLSLPGFTEMQFGLRAHHAVRQQYVLHPAATLAAVQDFWVYGALASDSAPTLNICSTASGTIPHLGTA